MPLGKRLFAESLGTFWLVLGGCGSAVLAAGFPNVGIGLHGVALAFGLTVLTMAYAIGHVSGCHLNPAVSVGLTVGGRFPASEVGPYIAAQVAGACVAAAVLFFIASGAPGFSLEGGFAANGFGEHSPGKYGLGPAFVTEVVMTFMFSSSSSARPTGARPQALPRSRSGSD
jgi:aquaporin Z